MNQGFSKTRYVNALSHWIVNGYVVEMNIPEQINLGCIDINPWNSRKTAPDLPDYIDIDLDPTVEAGKSLSRKQLHTESTAGILIAGCI